MNHQKHFQEEVIIFTRYPQDGAAKTRLIPKLGAAGAARLQRTMTELMVQAARQLMEKSELRVSIYFTDGSLQQMVQWLGPEFNYYEQLQADLGQRMMQVFRDAWKRGSKRAVLIGSDCPAIDSRLITEALSALQTNQLVLGPAADGGYYLVGMTDTMPDEYLSLLFTDMAWGTSEVFKATVDLARNTGLTTSILKQLHDIDHPRDLAHFRHHPDPQ